MAALLSAPGRFSPVSPFAFCYVRKASDGLPRRVGWMRSLGHRCTASCSTRGDRGEEERKRSFDLKDCALTAAIAVGLVTGIPHLGWPAHASPAGPVLPGLSVLISGPPIKDPGVLLRNALPINNKAIREVQKPLEDISESLKVSGVKALDLVERNVRQASRALSQGRELIMASVAESKKQHGEDLVNKLVVGLEELGRIVEQRDRDAVAPKQKELLNYVGGFLKQLHEHARLF
ncbi:hypothetical protein HPP92_019954 [Vanilla planifolia]|uniref:peptidylprolyl isomerase n=1 Tax=Vanilla planifolia TaxID=51239 RepID=A0A835UKB5_VANPL|nr:hypothetical protein HPP92_019954 [Vanilla planifolia]